MCDAVALDERVGLPGHQCLKGFLEAGNDPSPLFCCGTRPLLRNVPWAVLSAGQGLAHAGTSLQRCNGFWGRPGGDPIPGRSPGTQLDHRPTSNSAAAAEGGTRLRGSMGDENDWDAGTVPGTSFMGHWANYLPSPTIHLVWCSRDAVSADPIDVQSERVRVTRPNKMPPIFAQPCSSSALGTALPSAAPELADRAGPGRDTATV